MNVDVMHEAVEQHLKELSRDLLVLTEESRWTPTVKDDIRAYAREVELFARVAARDDER
jgi:hypothetical protein